MDKTIVNASFDLLGFALPNVILHFIFKSYPNISDLSGIIYVITDLIIRFSEYDKLKTQLLISSISFGLISLIQGPNFNNLLLYSTAGLVNYIRE